MSNFYTNVQSLGNNILYRGVNNGKRIKQKINYSPALFLPSKKKTPFKSLDGMYLEEKRFENIYAAKDFIKQFQNISNSPKIYAQDRFEYAYIAENFSEGIDYNYENILIAVIDIEVGSENGFPDPYETNEPITAICVKYLNGNTFIFGCGDYQNIGNEFYVKCKDEWTLCKKFLELWSKKCPDIVTGWNTKFFDIPYLVNRLRRIVGTDEVKRLSPWNFISDRRSSFNGRELKYYDLVGIASLDYIELYKWYAPGGKSQESYKLDNIANVELGERKLSYDEYESLHQLYKLNFQKFIEYNIKDVELIVKLEDKLKLLELATTLAYDTNSNYEDIFAQTRMWDSLTYSYLLKQNIIIPPREGKEKDSAFEGAYVKEPQIGMHNFVASFDLNSLYPHLIIQYNISPETLIQPENYTDEIRDIISSSITVDKMLKKEIDTSSLGNVTITPNGQFFRKDVQGFLPKMMKEMYEDRKKFKKLMLEAKQEYENEIHESEKFEIEKKIAKYNNIQLAKKVTLNSAYGAIGSKYFRFYDLRMALAVTTAGQLSIRWIENKINEYMNEILKTKKRDYVIASDTDSIYLRLEELIEKIYPNWKEMSKTKIIQYMDKVCELKIQPFIDKSYTELAEYVNAYQQKMQMKREGLSDKGIWTAKKRYILNVYNNEGVQYKEPQMKIMGLEMIKSSTPYAIRTKLTDAVRIIINEDEESIHRFIENFKQEFKNLPPEEISFPRGCNGLNTYSDPSSIYKKGTPIHVKGALLYNYYLHQKNLTKKYPLIQEGEKLKFTYLKLPNAVKDMVISYPGRLPPEFDLHKSIDYDTQFEKSFLDPLKIILDGVGWKTEKTSSLEDFFS